MFRLEYSKSKWFQREKKATNQNKIKKKNDRKELIEIEK